MDISWPHVHLMINHFPALGSLFGFALFGAGMYLGSEDVKKAALYTLVLTAVFSGITFLTGRPRYRGRWAGPRTWAAGYTTRS
jgi:hypothetical protein